MNKFCVVGLGYIGLPTASLLATKGFEVHGVDVDAQLVGTINRGEIPNVEPELDVLVRSAVLSGRLRAFQEPAPADGFILAVPTPIAAGQRPDVSHVEAATRAVAPHLVPGNLVILESTSPVGTTEKIAEQLRRLRPELLIPPRGDAGKASDQEPIYLAYCPERVLPGQILKELIDNDRIVGGIDPASTVKACAFYERFVAGRILPTDARTAEMCKLTENACRDVAIAFANELSMVCDRLQIDVWELIELANHHPRVDILQPGPGVGGHCIAIDPWFIIDAATSEARLLRCAREVNDHKPLAVVSQVKRRARRLRHPTIACLGLTYKPDVDDLRESPSCEIVRHLAADGAGEVLAVEPHIAELPSELEALGVRLVDLATALERAELVVVLVKHRAFLDIRPETLRGKGRIVIDVCGLLHGARSGDDAGGGVASATPGVLR
ncbi:MAG: UDP-N-acetyl-D-mannosamine dehydrogenase [bacterium]|nr:UDP-N-acetyl-D-mannosamine dehydrogenase [bacterium]